MLRGAFTALNQQMLEAKEAFRTAIRLANEIKAPIVVEDAAGVWQDEWGVLYREG